MTALKLILSLIVGLTTNLTIVQAGNDSIFLSPTDQKQENTDTSFQEHSLFLGSGYGNDLLYTGSSISDHQSFVSADITYSFMGKLWSSVMFYNLPGSDQAIPLIDFSAGYNHVFNDYFDVRGSLSYYHSSLDVEEDQTGSFAFLRIGGGFDWYWLYTRISAGRILEKDTGIYLYFRNSRYFRTPAFGKANHFFTLDPNINLLFGNYTQITPLTRGRGTGPQRPGHQGQGQDFTYYDSANTFSLLHAEIALPVSFYFYNFIFDVEPVYLIPLNKTDDPSAAQGFYFFMNLAWRIF
jgi:hypothetical protein